MALKNHAYHLEKQLGKTRFYFADGAVEGYFLSREEATSLLKKIHLVNKDLIFALGDIINLFILMRENYLKVHTRR